MQTGELDQRITFLRPYVTGQDASGADIFGTPEDLRTVWAAVEFLAGRELDVAMQRWAEARYKITIRRQAGFIIARTDYIAWHDQTLDILDVQGPGTRAPLWIILAKDHV